jgi:hypothetical protein
MVRFLPWALVAALVLPGCDDTVVVQLRTGPRSGELGVAELALPAELREDTAGGASRIASYPCGPTAICPTVGADLAIACEAAICDPAPHVVTVALGEVIDVDVLAADARDLLRQVDAIEVIAASYAVASNTLTVDVEPVEIAWAPESDVDPEAGPELVTLGVIPRIGAGAMESGALVLEPDGVARLSAHLVGRSRRMRLFARMAVDLAPGGAYPEGALEGSVDLEMRITGSVVR